MTHYDNIALYLNFFINELNQACLCRSVETYLLENAGTGFQVDKFFESVGVFIGVFSGSFFLGFAMGLVTALVSFQKFIDIIINNGG